MRNPRETGISSITGKVLTIRHANESEGIDVADIIKRRTGETLDISRDEIVIASQGERMLGFAVLKKDAREKGADVSIWLMADCTGASVGRWCVTYSIIPGPGMSTQTASLPGILLPWDLSRKKGP